jgi:hypothetical protein
VLEPEDDLLARPQRPLEPPVAPFELPERLPPAGPAATGEERRAELAQLGDRDVEGHRPFVEDVAPGEDVAADLRPGDRFGGEVAVGDMEHERQLYPCHRPAASSGGQRRWPTGRGGGRPTFPGGSTRIAVVLLCAP